MKRPLVIVSGLKEREAQFVRAHLSRWRRPCFLEATSRLRGDEALRALEIDGAERSLRDLKFDGVIRIGGVPTLRYWRDLEKSELPVACFSEAPFGGLPRVDEVRPLMALADFGLQHDLGAFEPWAEAERDRDRALGEKRRALLAEYPLSEPGWVHWLSGEMPRHARVFLGNSLPIREWDFAARAEAPRDVFASRGTNGIDGLVSTFAGLADPERGNWALIGDLSALYDPSGPWALRQRPIADFSLVVINNGGGQIFKRLFGDPLFLNSHDLSFAPWAKMWNLKYQRLETAAHLPALGEPRVVEIVPSAEQTDAFWAAWERA